MIPNGLLLMALSYHRAAGHGVDIPSCRRRLAQAKDMALELEDGGGCWSLTFTLDGNVLASVCHIQLLAQLAVQ